jgi:hypothetical protein
MHSTSWSVTFEEIGAKALVTMAREDSLACCPQTTGMCEEFPKTMKDRFFYDYARPHWDKYCYGETPMQIFNGSKKLALEKDNEVLYLRQMPDGQNLLAIK